MQLREGRKNRTYAFAFAIAACVGVLLCVFFTLPSMGAGSNRGPIQLSGRINPNQGPIGSLMRLPGVGPSRADAIIRYREAFDVEMGTKAFESAADLTKVKGIGPRTAEKIGPWLEF